MSSADPSVECTEQATVLHVEPTAGYRWTRTTRGQQRPNKCLLAANIRLRSQVPEERHTVTPTSDQVAAALQVKTVHVFAAVTLEILQ